MYNENTYYDQARVSSAVAYAKRDAQNQIDELKQRVSELERQIRLLTGSYK